jgi:hypothetical protein
LLTQQELPVQCYTIVKAIYYTQKAKERPRELKKKDILKIKIPF